MSGFSIIFFSILCCTVGGWNSVINKTFFKKLQNDEFVYVKLFICNSLAYLHKCQSPAEELANYLAYCWQFLRWILMLKWKFFTPNRFGLNHHQHFKKQTVRFCVHKLWTPIAQKPYWFKLCAAERTGKPAS
jgi:hypothetical protein